MMNNSLTSYDKIILLHTRYACSQLVIRFPDSLCFMILSTSTAGLNYFVLIMFIPAIIAILFNILQGKSSSMFGCVIARPTVKSMVFGTGYPLVFIATSAGIALITGLGIFPAAGPGGPGFQPL